MMADLFTSPATTAPTLFNTATVPLDRNTKGENCGSFELDGWLKQRCMEIYWLRTVKLHILLLQAKHIGVEMGRKYMQFLDFFTS
ncbi:hypothetical protein L2E82_10142 [Cichorium intybus]|uniref:Uncharacterized protein n=1 Tax=Cichorium intybus TaxID=13427 RepID=A0ACB9G9P8_CICIN|nr:hypothetical protein L2E82_10142 [Cichorium intybus]